MHTQTFMDSTTTYSCDTLVAGLILQSTPIDWWCLYWIHGDTDPSIYNVLDNPQLCHDLVHAHHSAVITGHPGHWKALELVSWNYWWPGLSRYIAKFVAGCDACN